MQWFLSLLLKMFMRDTVARLHESPHDGNAGFAVHLFRNCK
jgi:hypothetical protein